MSSAIFHVRAESQGKIRHLRETIQVCTMCMCMYHERDTARPKYVVCMCVCVCMCLIYLTIMTKHYKQLIVHVMLPLLP